MSGSTRTYLNPFASHVLEIKIMVDASGDDYYWSYGTVRPASEDDSTCVPLLNGTHLSDGRIPVVLGIGTGILAVSLISYLLNEMSFPEFLSLVIDVLY